MAWPNTPSRQQDLVNVDQPSDQPSDQPFDQPFDQLFVKR
jgi:hypothetical protein